MRGTLDLGLAMPWIFARNHSTGMVTFPKVFVRTRELIVELTLKTRAT